MFNRQPYNRGKFNAPLTVTSSNSGIALLKLGVIPLDAERTINASGQTDLKLGSLADRALVKYTAASCALIMDSLAEGAKSLIVDAGSAVLVMFTQATHQVSGEQAMRLEGLVLHPGDELVINTGDMTVTLNGQNAMQYFSADSEFITLLNGENILEYNDESTSRDISFDIIWKDRWL